MEVLAIGESTGSLSTEIGQTECMGAGVGRWVGDGQSLMKFSSESFYFPLLFPLYGFFPSDFFWDLLYSLLTS